MVLLKTISLLVRWQAWAARRLAPAPAVSGPLDLSAVQRVLVVRLDEIGDMVMFSPFLRALRRRLPDAHVTLVVKPGVKNLVARCPYVDEVLSFDQSGGRAWRFLSLPFRAWRFAAASLRRPRFDLAILPRWDADYYYAAFVAYFSGARWRAGYSEQVTPYKASVNGGFDRLLTEVYDSRGVRHDIQHNLALLEFLGLPPDGDSLEVWPAEDDFAFAEETLRAAGVGAGDVLVGMGPSGGHSLLKQWPVARFGEVGRRLQETQGARVLIFGGPGEEELGASLASALGPTALNLVGRTSLRQMTALLSRCRVYLGNDSGPTHLAAAAGVPVVAIFGSSCHHRFQPGERTVVVWRTLECGPCQRTQHQENRCHRCIYDAPRCLLDISVDEVLRAVTHQLTDPVRRLPMAAGKMP